MTFFVALVLFGLCVFASGIFSGGETGLYSLSRARVDAESHTHGSMRIVRRLLKDESALLVTLLVANNVVNKLAADLGPAIVAPLGVPLGARELVVTALLTPPLFLFGELVPKDLFRRRPHALVGIFAPVIAVVRVLLVPLAWPLRLLAGAVAGLFGLDASELVRVRGREAVIQLLRERGELERSQELERMARNVLQLRELRVGRVMVPWSEVEVLADTTGPEEFHRHLAGSVYTRHPVLGPGGAVRGYVHQLEVLAAGPGTTLAEHLRPLIGLDIETPLDRALGRMRTAGQRMALVGPVEAPLGIVTLKDLVEEISGELSRW